MGNFKSCNICGEYDWIDRHKCKPDWMVISPDWNDPDDPEDYYKGFGMDAEDAVKFCAEKHFSDWDYPEEMELWAKKANDKDWEKFDITVELDPYFTACKQVAPSHDG